MALCAERCRTRHTVPPSRSRNSVERRRVRGSCCRSSLSSTAARQTAPDPASPRPLTRREGPGRDTTPERHKETSTMPPRRARVLPFPPPRGSAPPGEPPPRRRPAGLVATLSIDASEVARLVARDLADEWVKGLIADHQRRSGPPSSSAPVPCGAPRRRPPHAPCRSTGRLANGRCRWHQGPQRP